MWPHFGPVVGDVDPVWFGGGGGAPIEPGKKEAEAIVTLYAPKGESIGDVLCFPIRKCWLGGTLTEKHYKVDADTPFVIRPVGKWSAKRLRRDSYCLPFSVHIETDIREGLSLEAEIAMAHLEAIAKDTLAREYLRECCSPGTLAFLKVLYHELWTFDQGQEHHLHMYNALTRWD